jgi:hypothetical protein
MVFATGSEFIAERPTGAGLTLGMGLRDIGGEAGLVDERRRSPAKPDGLGGEEGILERAGIYLAHWRSREFCS